MQNAAMIAKKLLVDDKIQDCVKQICLLGVVCNVSIRKTLSAKTFCFLKKSFLLVCKFCASSNLLFFFFFNDLLIGGVPFFKQGLAYKKGPDPTKGSKQQ